MTKEEFQQILNNITVTPEDYSLIALTAMRRCDVGVYNPWMTASQASLLTFFRSNDELMDASIGIPRSIQEEWGGRKGQTISKYWLKSKPEAIVYAENKPNALIELWRHPEAYD